MTEQKRAMLTLPDGLAPRLDKLKQTKFYNKTYSDMYRYLIEKGLEVEEKKGR